MALAAINRAELLVGRVVDGWPDSGLEEALREAADSLAVPLDHDALARECDEVAQRLPELMSALQARAARCAGISRQARQGIATAATIAGAVAIVAAALDLGDTRPADPVLADGDERAVGSFAALDQQPLRGLVAMLTDPWDMPAITATLERLMEEHDDLPVLVLSAALEGGQLTLEPRIAAQVQLFAMRSLLARNAAESAYRLAGLLEADLERVGTLPPGERLRLSVLTARAGRRCGRAALAGSQLAAAFADEPGDSGLWREYLTIAAGAATPLAVGLCDIALQRRRRLEDVDAVTVAEVLREAGQPEQAYRVAEVQVAAGTPTPDLLLALGNASLDLGGETLWRAAVERCFGVQDLPVPFDPGAGLRVFAFASAPTDAAIEPARPAVTVIMTAFNAAATIDGAIASVLAQSHQQVELIVVDDASDDDTRERVSAFADADPRVRLIPRDANHGTYAARNLGLAHATGTFVTFHDSDDWMHPERIERHLAAMATGAIASTSRWFRMDPSGAAVFRPGVGFLHLNPSSVFLRRSALDQLGPFDEVRAGADGELLARARAMFGAGRVTHLPLCLGIGLQHEGSLTASGPAALDRHRYSPVRSAYTEAWVRRHVAHAAAGGA